MTAARSAGRPGFRWGRTGKVYTYAPGDPVGRERARLLAEAQGRAIVAAQVAREDAVGGPRRIRNPDGVARLYERALRGRVRALELAVMGEVRPILKRMEKEEQRQDAKAEDIAAILALFAEAKKQWETVTSNGAAGLWYLGRTVDGHVASGIDKTVTRILKVPFASGGISEATIANWVVENTQAITALGADALDGLDTMVRQALADGTPTLKLRDQIQHEWGVRRNKASFYARDQTAKLTAKVNQHRQTSLGVDEYVWSSSGDSRVRQLHAELDGTVHRWDNPPIASRTGVRGHPGEVYQCRCTALPVLGDDDRARLLSEGEARKRRELQILQQSPTVRGEIPNRSGFSDWNRARINALREGDPGAVGLEGDRPDLDPFMAPQEQRPVFPLPPTSG